MADLTDEAFETAEERGRIAFETEPHAGPVRHDLKSGMTIVDLYNGCSFAFPPRRLRGLESATGEALAEVQISGRGHGLHGETRDADFTVGGLIAGRFGSAAHMARERGRWGAMLDEAEKNPRPHAA